MTDEDFDARERQQTTWALQVLHLKTGFSFEILEEAVGCCNCPPWSQAKDPLCNEAEMRWRVFTFVLGCYPWHWINRTLLEAK